MIKKIGAVSWKTLIKIQRLMMIITGIATVLFVFGPMVLREFGIPFPAYEEFLLIFAFWMYMMGSSYGSYEKSQITADIMSQVLKGKARSTLILAARISAFVLGVIFTYWALILIQWSLSTGAATSIYKIPVVLGHASIFVGLILSSFYNFVYMVEDIIKFKKGIALQSGRIQKTA